MSVLPVRAGRTADRPRFPSPAAPAALRASAFCTALALAAAAGGCGLGEWFRNGFKVGPQYERPPATPAESWIDATDVRVRMADDDLSRWWRVFNDPVLDELACSAYRQNLTLRQAGFRVLQARAQLGITIGRIFPQTQTATGGYSFGRSPERGGFGSSGGSGTSGTGTSTSSTSSTSSSTSSSGTRNFQLWDLGFNLSWELDLWGRFRRAIEADEANLEASVEGYDDILVTLLADLAANYVQLRTSQQQLEYARANAELQRETLKLAEARLKAGSANALDVEQSRSTLEQTESQIPEFQTTIRRATNQICALMGIPPEELQAKLGPAPIPAAPAEIVVGIPADLLRRRPDVRRAERLAAAQSALIGVAAADFYPAISVNGTIGFSAADAGRVFTGGGFGGVFGPSFRWDILNYGRITNAVRLQEARFNEAVAAYQNAVLTADQEAENGLTTFLNARQRADSLARSVTAAEKAVRLSLAQFKAGTVDFNRLITLQQSLVLVQDLLAQARGEIAQGVIQTYRALGGGWQIRLTDCEPSGRFNSPLPRPPDFGMPAPLLPPVPPMRP